MPKNTGHINERVPYHVDRKLVTLWGKNSLYNMKKYNNDRVYIVDGRERAGKSWFAFQQMCYLEPSLLNDVEKFTSRICFSPNEFDKTCRNLKNGVIVFDEAFRGLSSRSSLSKTNKMIVQTLMEVGQNNNIIFIVLPSFFLLDVYPAMLRSDNLFHIYQEPKTRMRAFVGYNRDDKNKIYQEGLRKGWKYTVYSKFKGRYYGKFPGGKKFEEAYLKKKNDYVQKVKKENTPEEKRTLKDDYFSIFVTYFKIKNNLTETETEKALKELGIEIKRSAIGYHIRKVLEHKHFQDYFNVKPAKKSPLQVKTA